MYTVRSSGKLCLMVGSYKLVFKSQTDLKSSVTKFFFLVDLAASVSRASNVLTENGGVIREGRNISCPRAFRNILIHVPMKRVYNSSLFYNGHSRAGERETICTVQLTV